MTERNGTPEVVLTLDDLRREPPTISVARVAQYMGSSRTQTYEMVRRGALPSIKLGNRRVVVPTAPLLRLLDGQQ